MKEKNSAARRLGAAAAFLAVLFSARAIAVFAEGSASAAPDASAAAKISAPIIGHFDTMEWKPSAALPVGYDYHLMWEDPTTGGIQALVRLAKGSALPPHFHDCRETLIVLRGKLHVRAGTEDRTLTEGDYIVLPAKTVHEIQAAGRKEVVMILVTDAPFGVKPAPKSP